MNAIEIKNLTKHYPGFTLDHLTLTLPEGCILGLIGENGAGKSTTIRLLLDLIRKDEGSIRIYGKEPGEANVLQKDEIGVVLDKVGMPLMLKAEQIGKIMSFAYKNWDAAEYDALLTKFSVPLDKKFQELSNGNKMKIGLAIALSHHAKLLILDEATNGLDPIVRDTVNEMLMEFTRDPEHAILISSHLVTDLEKLCDYIAFIHKGKLMLCEEKDELLGEYGIWQGSREELQSFAESAVLHSQVSAYGAKAIVRKDAVPSGTDMAPVSIEELFVTMVKEDRAL